MLSLRTDVLPQPPTDTRRSAPAEGHRRSPHVVREGRLDHGRLALALGGLALNTAAWAALVAGVVALVR